MFIRTLSLLSFFLVSQVASHGHLSRHLITDDLSMVVVMADAGTTQGPFDEEVEDYVNTSDMTAAAKAGFPGVEEDRETVLGGVPFNLSLTVYDLSNADQGYANEFEDVEVFLWHTDAAGVYSAVEQARQSVEGTDGQVWLRAYQTTGADGKVTFQTILPGWYTGRAIHYHVRLRFQGSETWAATSQFLVNDTARAMYDSIEPYASNSQQKTALATDNIYTGLDSSVADLLTLTLHGSVSNGFTSSVEMGLLPSDTSDEDSGADGGGNNNGGGNGGGRPDFPGNDRTPSPTAAREPTHLPAATPQVVPTLAPQGKTTYPSPQPTTAAPQIAPTLAPQIRPTYSSSQPTTTSTTNTETPQSAPTRRPGNNRPPNGNGGTGGRPGGGFGGGSGWFGRPGGSEGGRYPGGN
eukprot:Nitzschia sp. Nitz4//scaffold138_size62050//44155//45378//NITZ4_006393-RA/size62050-processed-gene-0.50-mRNA-1//1//CDS//3329535782//7708//frame0